MGRPGLQSFWRQAHLGVHAEGFADRGRQPGILERAVEAASAQQCHRGRRPPVVIKPSPEAATQIGLGQIPLSCSRSARLSQ